MRFTVDVPAVLKMARIPKMKVSTFNADNAGVARRFKKSKNSLFSACPEWLPEYCKAAEHSGNTQQTEKTECRKTEKGLIIL